MKNIEDNPVPSIDNNDISFLKGIQLKFLPNPNSKRFKSILSKLQNGVENDNESPSDRIMSHSEL